MNKKNFKFDWNKTKEVAAKKVEDQNKKNKDRFKDDRFYYPDISKNSDKTGEAIIRFLAMKMDANGPMYELPYAELAKHNFKDNGGYFVENCPSSIGLDCPVCQEVGLLYKELKALGIDPKDKANKDVPKVKNASEKYKKKELIVNIQVVKDPQTPELNGKVFFFRVNKTIKDKIFDKYDPPVKMKDGKPDPNAIQRKSIPIWDYVEGLDFHLKITRKGGNADYSTSEFLDPRAISDEEIERINEEMHTLKEFESPEIFKSYDVLKEKYFKVVGISAAPKNTTKEVINESVGSVSTSDDTVTINEDDVVADDDFFNTLDSNDEE